MVDLIGPWTVKAQNSILSLQCLITIDIATCWIEITHIHSKESENIALIFDREWLALQYASVKVKTIVKTFD